VSEKETIYLERNRQDFRKYYKLCLTAMWHYVHNCMYTSSGCSGLLSSCRRHYVT